MRRTLVLAEPDRTAYDLNFRLFGFPVRVHPLFWLGAVLLGADYLRLGIEYLVMWVVVVFVSIVLHELGHAVAYRRFGSSARVVLWVFGGVTIGNPEVATRNQKVLVLLAGPFAGFLLCGVLYASHLATGWGSLTGGLFVASFYSALIFVNLYWGVLNLLPVFPLDGGQVCREVCRSRWGGRGVRIAYQVSIGVAVAVAAYGILCEIDRRSGGTGLLATLPWWFPRGSLFSALLFGLLAYQSYRLLRLSGGGYYYHAPGDRLPWER
jgi:stage IV sporulation protein FB